MKKFSGGKTITPCFTVRFCHFINLDSFQGEKHIFLDRYGWGIYEGQCDREGNTCGFGRWIATWGQTAKKHEGLVYTGCFKNDKNEGYGEF